jgi:acylphosphatase
MPRSSVKIIVTGLVQGVNFRYFVYHKATDLGLTGYAKNLDNGQVEIIASGEKGLIDELVEQVRIGPRMSSVSNVELEEIELEQIYNDFGIM